MAYKPTCLVCQKEMEKGFITDFNSGSVMVPRWCAGEPNPSFWAGGEANRAQVREGHKVIAYRCPECEALRLYAPSKS